MNSYKTDKDHYCEYFFTNIADIIEEINNNLVRNFVNVEKSNLACIDQKITYEKFSKELEDNLSELSNIGPCNSVFINTLSNKINLQLGGFNYSDNGINTVIEIIKLFIKRCYCKKSELIGNIISLYLDKYATLNNIKGIGNMLDVDKIVNNEKLYNLLKQYTSELKEILNNIDNFEFVNDKLIEYNMKGGNIIDKIKYKLSIRGELERLLPKELGSMKNFFIEIIATYYEKLHPVIWSQILSNGIKNFSKDLPMTYSQMFSFGSKQLLLNSGPYILKILQMVRPILSKEIKDKYNLNKLTYPLLNNTQIECILDKILINRNQYKVKLNISASVGHVCILQDVTTKKDFVLKIIKPISIVQSCWEYNTLTSIFGEGTCENSFVKSMMNGIGAELDVNHEKENINKGLEYYTCEYDSLFGFNTGHKLTTLENLEGYIKDDCWYALTVNLVPGVPLSKYVENDLVKNNTIYQASLHRCFDLLVYKFFNTLFLEGYYHGDLHAGNIFFSFKEKTMTLIDFGAVGKLNLNRPDTEEEKRRIEIFIELAIMSSFNNFPDILEKLTAFLNTLCINEKNEGYIDNQSQSYKNVLAKLEEYRLHNIRNKEKNKIISEENIKKFFSEETIEKEKYEIVENINKNVEIENLYSYLELKDNKTENIQEEDNRDEIYNLALQKIDSYSLVDALEIILKFYAESGVNLAIKFADLYDFQKAYALILGVSKQINYDSTRMSHVINKAILNGSSIFEFTAKRITYPSQLFDISSIYFREKEIFNNIKSSIDNVNISDDISDNSYNLDTLTENTSENSYNLDTLENK